MFIGSVLSSAWLTKHGGLTQHRFVEILLEPIGADLFQLKCCSLLSMTICTVAYCLLNICESLSHTLGVMIG